jgi:hypothetical protein
MMRFIIRNDLEQARFFNRPGLDLEDNKDTRTTCPRDEERNHIE